MDESTLLAQEVAARILKSDRVPSQWTGSRLFDDLVEMVKENLKRAERLSTLEFDEPRSAAVSSRRT